MSQVTARLGLLKPGYGQNIVEGETLSGQSNQAANEDLIDAAIAALQDTDAAAPPIAPVDYAADGAITQKQGTVTISKASAAAMTVVLPTTGVDDGKRLLIFSKTAFAHTVLGSGGSTLIQGSSNNFATFGAAVGNCFELLALGGRWQVLRAIGVTFSSN